MTPALLSRGPGGGASVNNACRNGCTPKSFNALPKKTGVCLACRYASGSKRVPAPVMISTASISCLLALGSHQFFDDRVSRGGDGDGFHPPSSLLPLVEEHRVCLEVVDTTEVRSVAERPVHRCGGNPEHTLDLVEQLEWIPGRLIELVDERQDGQAVRATDLEELERLRFHALGRIQHHHHAIHREQRAVRVLAEVLVAGRVEQRHVVPLELELERRRADGDTALLLHLHPVRHRVALRPAPAYRPGKVDRAGIQEQLLRQGWSCPHRDGK